MRPAPTAASRQSERQRRALQRREQRDIGAGREVKAIGEIDDAEHAEHQREAEREQRIGRAGDETIDDLLGEH